MKQHHYESHYEEDYTVVTLIIKEDGVVDIFAPEVDDEALHAIFVSLASQEGDYSE